MEETKLGTSQVEIVATKGPKTKLKKEKTIKVRMDVVDLYELDEICRKLGFGERATVVRKLIHDFQNLDRATKIVEAHKKLLEAQKTFFELL